MFLSYLIYPLHLWLMNVAVGITLLQLWLEWEGRGNPLAWSVNRRLARMAWMSLIAGSLVGLLHGALIWDAAWRAKLGIVYWRIFFGVIELLTSLILMIAYDLWLRRRAAPNRWWAWIRWLLPLVASTNLLYHFPALFGVLNQIDVNAFAPDATMSSAEFRATMLSPPVIANWLHFSLSCLAVAPIVGLLTTSPLASTEPGGEEHDRSPPVRLQRVMALVSAVATLAQWIVGAALLVSIDRFTIYQLTGGDWILTAWFLQSLVLVFLLSVLQVRLVLRPTDRELAQLVCLLQLLVIFAMSLLALVFQT